MRYNAFNEPVPSNVDELDEALQHFDMVVSDVNIWIDYDPEGDVFKGWSANVDDGQNSFTTTGFESKDDLFLVLNTVGIRTRGL